MTIKYNVPGKERKRMVLTIAKWLGEEVKYIINSTWTVMEVIIY